MKSLLAIAAAILLSLTTPSGAQQAGATADIVRAANTFLSSLNAEQRQKVMYAFDD
jgi:hypothetical protein